MSAKMLLEVADRLTAVARHHRKPPRLAPEAKCSSLAEVLALQGRRLFRTRELGAEVRHHRK
ncbi:hypothetical protein [Parageobacillus thermantarcticus]|uniref:hypothetical protein n=1 Tax=Parageobacillus thermantarcticus TaxID=186116 RepID=UPI0011609B9F|nr:hypothetical protein [Parageobacillus thermantarcticus]